MAVSYIDPVERAWSRTQRILFRKFDIETWVTVGFAAFLAGLAGEWAGLRLSPGWGYGFPPHLVDLLTPPFHGSGDFLRGIRWFGAPLALIWLGVGVGLLWLGSRGKFVLLDDLVHERPAIVEPWNRYGKLGDSLFFWRLGFCVVALTAFALFVSPIFWLGHELTSAIGRPLGTLASFGATALSILLGLTAAFVALLLESFVVPLMYHRGIRSTEAWRLFLPLLRAHLPEFLVYGLLILFAGVGVVLCLIAVSILSCCILPLLLSLPYVRSVVLLPLTALLRLYSLEFLQQFGPDYTILGVPTEPDP